MLAIARPRWLRLALVLLSLTLISTAVIANGGATASAAGVNPAARGLKSGLDAPRVVERTFYSASLERDMPLTVYLPPGYDATSRRYPVLYILHGLGRNHEEWGEDGLFTTATRLIRDAEIPPMIIVAPDGGSGYWMDHYNRGPRYGSYVTDDIVGLVDRDYRTIRDRNLRAIGGMSMGAQGALQIALNNPAEFGIVGAHSLVLRNKDQAFDFFGDLPYFEAHDPVSICRKDPRATARLTLWIDIADGDPWLPQAQAFHDQLESDGIGHAWHVYPGQHDDSYWRAHTGDYLAFYGAAFSRALRPV